MLALRFIFTQVLTIVTVVTGFKTSHHHGMIPSGLRQREDNNGRILTVPRSSISDWVVRPALVFTAANLVAVTILISTPVMPSMAADFLHVKNNNNYNDKLLSVIADSEYIVRRDTCSDQQRPTTTSCTSSISSMQLLLSSSTMANPIGEKKDGSNNMENSFGQWFFIIYIVVSLLAGGKEIFQRIQKQIMERNNDDA